MINNNITLYRNTPISAPNPNVSGYAKTNNQKINDSPKLNNEYIIFLGASVRVVSVWWYIVYILYPAIAKFPKNAKNKIKSIPFIEYHRPNYYKTKSNLTPLKQMYLINLKLLLSYQTAYYKRR